MQPVAITGNSPGGGNRGNKRNPLPCVASGCKSGAFTVSRVLARPRAFERSGALQSYSKRRILPLKHRLLGTAAEGRPYEEETIGGVPRIRVGAVGAGARLGARTAPNNESATYEWHLEVPNVAMAPNGDTVAVTGTGTFGVHPKSASGGGSFTHTFAGGGSLTGTYTVGGLVDFQPYGRGVVFGNPLPPDLCGGRLVLRVSLVPDANPSLSLDDLLPDRRTAAERRGGDPAGCSRSRELQRRRHGRERLHQAVKVTETPPRRRVLARRLVREPFKGVRDRERGQP